MKALSRSPDGRFQSADEFGEAIDDVAGRVGVAKTRDVAEVVRSLDADKLQGERQRVRDSIEMLGRAEIAASKVPMPRGEGTPPGSQTYNRDGGTGSYVHGSVSGVLSDGTPVVVRAAAPDSNALKWLVMVLAVVVFLYAGFLVWQLLRPPAAQEPAERSPTVEVEPSLPVPPTEPAAVEAVDAESTERSPEEAKKAPERKSSTVSPRPRRRRARPKSQRAAKPAPEPAKPAKKAPPSRQEPAPEADPVDIDIQNPYRN